MTDPAAGLPWLRQQLASHPERLFLATCRPRRSGGNFAGSAAAELAILSAAAEAGFAWVDLSLESAEELGPEALQRLREAGASVLLSWHDFAGMGDPAAVLARIRAFAPDLVKLVPTAPTLDDSLDLLALLGRERLADAPSTVVAIAMGEAGLLTRVLGPRAGSPFTFAALTEAEATAPGQLTAETLARLYRIGQLTPATRLFGVAGDPIRSSLSPLMFNTVFGHEHLDAAYLPLLTHDPATLFRAARELPLEGFSVTMPLKQSILPLLASLDPLAARIGAVNTVRRSPDGGFAGTNTDVVGIVTPLEQRLSLRGTRVLVLGAGGAARAAVFGCLDRGASVVVASRSPERAQALAGEACCAALSMQQLATERFEVLINATPAGMHGNPDPLPLREDQLHAELVFDLVYNPADTPLLTLARARGLQTIPGLEMFIHQGARQYELWTGNPAPLDLMRSTVREALDLRSAVRSA